MDPDQVKRLQNRIEKAKESNELEKVKDLYVELGAYFYQWEKFEEAIDSYEQALIICKSNDWPSEEAAVQREIAETLSNLGEYEKSIKYVNNYVKLSKKTCDVVQEQRGYATKGRIYLCWAEVLVSEKSRDKQKIEALLKESVIAFKQSLKLCGSEMREVDLKTKQKMKSRVLQNLGLVMGLMGKYDEAKSYFATAIQINKTQNFTESLYWCYVNQGEHFFRARDCKSACIYFDLAKSVSGSTEKSVEASLLKVKALLKMSDTVNAKNILRDIYKQQKGKNREVVEQLRLVVFLCRNEKTIHATETTDYATKKTLYEKQGDAFCALKEYTQGAKAYLKMLENSQLNGNSGKELLPCYTSLAQTFRDDEQYDSALIYCEKELSLLDEKSLESCKTYIFLGELYEYLNYDYGSIYDVYKKALNISLKIRDRDQEILSVKRMSEVQRRFGYFIQAEENEKIWKRMEKNRKRASPIEECDEDDENSGEQFCVDIGDDELFSETEEDKQRQQNKRKCFKIKRNQKGETELHTAAIRRDFTKVKALIQCGHPVNVTDSCGWTPLHEACNHGFVRIAEYLINNGADINHPGGDMCGGITPLHDAAENGHLSVIKLLLRNGACTTILTDSGDTPLDCLEHWKNRTDPSGEELTEYKKLREDLKTNLDLLPSKEKRRRWVADLELDRRVKCLQDCDEEETRIHSYDPKSTNFSNPTVESASVSHPKPSNITDCHVMAQPRPSSSKPSSATEIYKAAIKSVGRRNPPREAPKTEKKPLAPLISEEEVLKEEWFDDDSWLEDDFESTVQSPKRRKVTNDSDTIELEPPFRRKNDDMRRICDNTLFSDIFAGDSAQSDQISSTNQESRPEEFRAKESPPRRPPVVEKPPEAGKQGGYLKFKVPILDDVLLIPVPKSDLPDLTVQWLADAAAARYAQIYGRKPNMLLMTGDNAIAVGKDPLCLLLDEDIKTRILSWADIKLGERYEEECSRLENYQPEFTFPLSSVNPVAGVVNALNTCSRTEELLLCDLSLETRDLVPVFKALEGDKTRIRKLDLSRNSLGDSVFEILISYLGVGSFEDLHLLSNGLTANGIKGFAARLDVVPKPNLDRIKVLDFSFNNLTDESVEHLNAIIDKLDNLKTFTTRRCGISKKLKRLTTKVYVSEDDFSD